TFMACRIRRCTGFSPSSMAGTARSRITYEAYSRNQFSYSPDTGTMSWICSSLSNCSWRWSSLSFSSLSITFFYFCSRRRCLVDEIFLYFQILDDEKLPLRGVFAHVIAQYFLDGGFVLQNHRFQADVV